MHTPLRKALAKYEKRITIFEAFHTLPGVNDSCQYSASAALWQLGEVIHTIGLAAKLVSVPSTLLELILIISKFFLWRTWPRCRTGDLVLQFR